MKSTQAAHQPEIHADINAIFEAQQSSCPQLLKQRAPAEAHGAMGLLQSRATISEESRLTAPSGRVL